MGSTNIERLLDAYFEGGTTVDQEKQLREYFNNGDVAPQLEQYAPLFIAFAKAQQDRYTGEINLPRKKRSFGWMGIAASILIVIGLFLTFGKNEDSYDYGTYKDPEVAAYKTKQALFMMGSFMNQGTQQLEVFDEVENTTDKYINKRELRDIIE